MRRLSGQPGFGWGQLWEWTASPFEPYPGFEAGPYREYSAPWFMTHQVLRGASFATPSRFGSASFRNFYLPERDDMFAGLPHLRISKSKRRRKKNGYRSSRSDLNRLND